MKKVELAAQMIEKRIVFGDFIVLGMPSERQLAEELGLSRNTVRAAVQQLIENGTLVRQENGRLETAAAAGGHSKRTIGFVTPIGYSAEIDKWRHSVYAILQGQMATVRLINYAHWADRAIQEALSGLDGLFFIPKEEEIPSWLVAKMKNAPCRVVVLEQDYSSAGLPSVTLFPPVMEQKLFDLLRGLGHRRIDCVNTQAQDSVIRGRISAWKEFLKKRNVAGRMFNMEQRHPIESAYQLIRDALNEGHPVASALFCTTGLAAIGAMRALHEVGLNVGTDVSVCAVNSEGLGRYLIPSMTALESPPRSLFLHRACEWMLSEDTWQGPLLIQPEDVPLVEGESTGPAPSSPFVSLARM